MFNREISQQDKDRVHQEGAILPLWKKKGESTHRLTQKVAQYFDCKCAHTGILDPLAEGVIVVLIGEKRFQRAHYTQTKKIYRAEVCTQISTDSLDLLGIVEMPPSINDVDRQNLENQLHNTKNNYIGLIEQIPPVISNIKIKGKRAQYWLKKKGEVPLIPSKSVQVYDISLLSIQQRNHHHIIQQALQQIPLVHGVFRQDQCIRHWQKYSSQVKRSNTLTTILFEATVGSGCYIRSLAQDWLKSVGIERCVLLNLIRIQNASFTQIHCNQLIFA